MYILIPLILPIIINILEDNDFKELSKQIQDDIKGLTELSGRLVELDKEENKINKHKAFLIAAMVICVSGISYCLYELYCLLK